MSDFREYKAAFLEQNDLAHFGILGMKWGVRRYQNPDGSLTAAGRKRYGTEENFNNIMNAAKKGGLAGALAIAKVKKQQKNGSKNSSEKIEKKEQPKKEQDWEKDLEESRKILSKEVYGASDKKFTSICREYYKHMKKQGRTRGLSEEEFIEHMKDDGWQDDADEWYLKKYHNRSL